MAPVKMPAAVRTSFSLALNFLTMRFPKDLVTPLRVNMTIMPPHSRKDTIISTVSGSHTLAMVLSTKAVTKPFL